MTKTNDLDLKVAKAVLKAAKLLDKMQTRPVPTTTNRSTGFFESLGLVDAPIHKAVYNRFMHEGYNDKVPLTLLLKYAMDAVDDGTLVLPTVDEARREFSAMIDATLDEARAAKEQRQERDPLDLVKEQAEAQAPDSPAFPFAPNIVRFTNNPLETNHDHDL